MKKIVASLALSFVSILAFAQNTNFTISGKIIDAVTKAPLQAASVFAQNTTMGTTTNTEGIFTLHLPYGGYDMVVTFTGYETVSRRISTPDADDKNIVIELKQKEKAMEEIAITSSNEVKDGWEKYGDFFTENFIGKTANSKLCVIKNKEALKFYFSKKRNRLKVLCPDPLLIENPSLGYKIKYTLDSFTYDYGTLASTFTGYPLFEEMQPADSIQSSMWKANRMVAYKGSILHFMRSVYHKNLQEEGFEVQLIGKFNGLDTAIKVANFYAALNYEKDDSTKVIEISPNQPDIAVLYKNEMPEAAYSKLNDDAPTKFELSFLNVAASQTIGIEQNGFYFNQNDIIMNGYWSWEKTGDMLPYDFKPE